MRTELTLRRFFAIVAIVLGCALVILSVATLVAANSGGVPTVNGLFYGDGDEDRYYFLGENPGRGTLYYNREGNTLYLAVVVSNTVNDNVFGDTNVTADVTYVKSAGWNGSGNHHNAKALINSDNVELRLQCGANSWTWKHGYVYDADGDGNPHEADWLSGHGDADGGGTPPPGLISEATSFQWNLNNTTWDVTLGGARSDSSNWKSPDDGDNNVSDEGYPTWDATHQWEWAMVYEMSIDVTVCGNNTIIVSVPSAHNSPPKSGDQDVPICESGCSLPASIGNFVWIDANANGIQDAGESGLDGVTVKLYDSLNNLKGTTSTSGGGFYNFTNLAPGNYYVEFVAPSGYVFTSQDQGGDNTTDSDANPTNGKTIVTTLVSGETDLTWDAGLVQLGLIGDYVWNDIDRDGIQDSGESGIPGVAVELYLDANSDGVPQDGELQSTDLTDGNGLYLFTGLAAGNYIVKVADSNFNSGAALYSYFVAVPNAGGDDTKDSDGHPTTYEAAVTLASGENNMTIDFGFSDCEIGDRVWHDQDGQGDQDASIFPPYAPEPGFNGVAVYLYSSDGDAAFEPGSGDTLLYSTTTISGTSRTPDGWPNGIYGFDMSLLGPGEYWVWVDESTLPNPGLNMQWVSTTGNNPFRLTYPGGDVFSIDFGYVAESTPTAVTLSSFIAKSSAGGPVSPLWLGLVGLTVLVAGCLFWANRRISECECSQRR